jgi:hypothetical protein
MPSDAQIAGGHKANLNNPNTSEESKQHSREVLDNEFNGGENGMYLPDVYIFPSPTDNVPQCKHYSYT